MMHIMGSENILTRLVSEWVNIHSSSWDNCLFFNGDKDNVKFTTQEYIVQKWNVNPENQEYFQEKMEMIVITTLWLRTYMDRVRYYSPGLLIPTHYLTHLKLEDSVTASQYRPIPDPHKPAFYGLDLSWWKP